MVKRSTTFPFAPRSVTPSAAADVSRIENEIVCFPLLDDLTAGAVTEAAGAADGADAAAPGAGGGDVDGEGDGADDCGGGGALEPEVAVVAAVVLVPGVAAVGPAAVVVTDVVVGAGGADGGVTVTVNDASGVELPCESCARQLTVVRPTVNRLPEEKLQTRLYGGNPPVTLNENDTGAQYVDRHGTVACAVMSAGAVIASVGGGGGGGGGGDRPPSVTVMVNDA